MFYLPYTICYKHKVLKLFLKYSALRQFGHAPAGDDPLNFINFNFILPNVNTDYIRQAQVMNIDHLRLIQLLMKFFMKT